MKMPKLWGPNVANNPLPTTLSGTHGVEPSDNRTSVEIRHAPLPAAAQEEVPDAKQDEDETENEPAPETQPASQSGE